MRGGGGKEERVRWDGISDGRKWEGERWRIESVHISGQACTFTSEPLFEQAKENGATVVTEGGTFVCLHRQEVGTNCVIVLLCCTCCVHVRVCVCEESTLDCTEEGPHSQAPFQMCMRICWSGVWE